MKSWVTKTAGWLAIILGLGSLAFGVLDAGTATTLVTTGMGFIGIDRKFKRLVNSQDSQP
jgi:hypothetical protein